MSRKDTRETFQPILDFMGYKPGMAFADLGAGSGALTVMMASLMDSSDVYIQDIDTALLKKTNVDKMIDFYSKQSHKDLRHTNHFEVTLGTAYATNFPDSSLDLIYSNATTHCFASLDSIAADLRNKLRAGGMLFLRDSFKGDHGEAEYCSDSKCGKRLLTIDECVAIMQRNGYVLIRKSPNMSGYPVFGFGVR